MAGRHEKDKDKGVNVQVLLRCRPFNDDEIKANAPQVISCHDQRREVTVYQNIASKQIDRTFTFDKVFGPSSQQRDLYDQAIIPIVNEVLEGFNCTIFAYGQTGTGKTYTMEGAGRKPKSGELPSEAGVIPRAVQQIFDTLESQNAEYSVKVTFLELYNEEITDLLAPEELSKVMGDEKQKKPLALMEDGKGGVLVRGLEEEIVTSANEIYSLLDRGSSKRRTAETLLNKQSSRSHSIFSITIHIKEATPEGEELIKCGKLNLVDLAGSENICRSGAREGRAREAGEINKSLLTLGRVITALVEHLGHIPYRDSKLTRLLRDSLGGRTKTCIIATVSPSVHCLEETLSTLDYAHRAKNIRNKPEVNQKMMKSALIKDLYGEIERLKSEVYAAREKNGIYVPRERYYQDEADKKAMTERIEHMEYEIETKDKHLDEIQELCERRQQHNTELQAKLVETQAKLEETVETLSTAKENLRQTLYAVHGREFVISRQQDAETVLVEQACKLCGDLETAAKEIDGLFQKIERKGTLESYNKKLVGTFREELSVHLQSLNCSLGTFLSQQQKQLQALEQQLGSFMSSRNENVDDLKERLEGLKRTCCSRLQSVHGIVGEHQQDAVHTLDKIQTAVSTHYASTSDLLSAVASQADGTLEMFESHLSEQQRELALFAQQQRESCRHNAEAASAVLTLMVEFCGKLREDVTEMGRMIDETHKTRHELLSGLSLEYQEMSKREEKHLQDEISTLLVSVMDRSKKMVAERINSLMEASAKDTQCIRKSVLDAQVAVSHTEDRLNIFVKEADVNARDASALLAARHCHMEELLQQSVKDTGVAADKWKSSLGSLRVLGENNVPVVAAIFEEAHKSECLFSTTLGAANMLAQEEVSSEIGSISTHTNNVHATEHEVLLSVQSHIGSHCRQLKDMEMEHTKSVEEITGTADTYLSSRYKEDQPTCTTPRKRSIEIPTSACIQQLRAPHSDVLLQEFQDKHSPRKHPRQENAMAKEGAKAFTSLEAAKRETRIPLTAVNRMEL
ncbi:kinesin-like protein KIN-5C [Selaginella moellendorffii]|uniref:kinesin-like protein KIN-5C n=1 Tax=Selaginella moellendorffii TaxID=88036 RepID=UPI000D1C2FA6|nr:kinesin-like protein KIN-5C [Selaginella moellendorffii]|eukprot:XP_024516332.1 kinesin-like protein KIN-5C [Selaginella moellendorffii]